MMKTYTGMVPLFEPRHWGLPALLAERARSGPERIFLRWTDEDPGSSYAAVFEAVCALAGSLRAAGVEEADRVVLLMHNSLQHIACWFALNVLGAVDAPINPAYTSDILGHQIKLVRPRLIICERDLLPGLDGIRDTLDALGPIRILVNEPGTAAALMPRIADLRPAAPVRPGPADPRRPSSVLYTSGTTGPSKGVLMPEGQIYFYSDQTVNLHRMRPDDIYMAPFPLFHASARIHGVGAALVSGGTCVLYDKFSATAFAERAARSRATLTHFLGSMMKLILDRPPSPDDARSRLRSVMALPMPTSQVQAFCDRFGAENMPEVIGMTETSWPIMSPYGEPRPPGAAGLLVAEWYDAQVIDPDTDLPVADGIVGEFVIRPRHPWIMSLTYENMPGQSVEATRNLWFHTGDMVRRDAEGWFYFCDRLKDSIRRRGENISSFEVEEAALSFEGISDCAATAYQVPGEERDEEIVLFYIAAPSSDIPLEALARHLEARLPRFAMPRYYRQIDELPKTPGGKIQKAKLRAMGLDAGTRERPA